MFLGLYACTRIKHMVLFFKRADSQHSQSERKTESLWECIFRLRNLRSSPFFRIGSRSGATGVTLLAGGRPPELCALGDTKGYFRGLCQGRGHNLSLPLRVSIKCAPSLDIVPLHVTCIRSPSWLDRNNHSGRTLLYYTSWCPQVST